MEQKFNWKKFFESRLFFVSGLVILTFLSVNLTRAQLKDRAIRADTARLQEQVNALNSEREKYETIISSLDKSEFLEREARETLGYAKPGEKVVVIDKKQQDQQDQQDQQGMPNPVKWWVYFFGDI